MSFFFSDPYFIANTPFLWRIAFMSASMIVVRLKYYFAWIVGKICGLLIKREVKIAGYWPSYCFEYLCTETELRSINTQTKNEANIQLSCPNKLGQ